MSDSGVELEGYRWEIRMRRIWNSYMCWTSDCSFYFRYESCTNCGWEWLSPSSLSRQIRPFAHNPPSFCWYFDRSSSDHFYAFMPCYSSSHFGWAILSPSWKACLNPDRNRSPKRTWSWQSSFLACTPSTGPSSQGLPCCTCSSQAVWRSSLSRVAWFSHALAHSSSSSPVLGCGCTSPYPAYTKENPDTFSNGH